MNFTIKTFPTTKFIGKSVMLSYADYRIYELWSSFMPRLKEVENKIGTALYNIQINPENFDFKPTTAFQKWATVPVSNFDKIPKGMQMVTIPTGLYAVFYFTGGKKTIPEYFKNIYTIWLPQSDYELENRAQFEILGEKYRRDSEESEEEIWIPVRKKN